MKKRKSDNTQYPKQLNYTKNKRRYSLSLLEKTVKNFNIITTDNDEIIINKYKDLLINDPYKLNTINNDTEIYTLLNEYPFLLHFIKVDYEKHLDLIEDIVSKDYNCAKFIDDKVLIDNFLDSNIEVIKYLEEENILNILPKIMLKSFYNNNSFYVLLNTLENKLKEDPEFLYNKFKDYDISNIVFDEIFNLINYKFNPDTFFIIILLYNNIDGFPEYLERVLSLIPKEKYTNDDIISLLIIALDAEYKLDIKYEKGYYRYNIIFKYFKENIYNNIEKFNSINYNSESIIKLNLLEYTYDKNIVDILKRIPLTKSNIRNSLKILRYITDEELEEIFISNKYIESYLDIFHYSSHSNISSKIKDHYVNTVSNEEGFFLSNMILKDSQINTIISRDIEFLNQIYNLQESQIKDILKHTNYKYRISLLQYIIYNPNIFGEALEDTIKEYFKLILD